MHNQYCNLLCRGYRMSPNIGPKEQFKMQMYMCNKCVLTFGMMFLGAR